MADFDLWVYVVVYEHELMYEDRIFHRFMIRAKGAKVAEEVAMRVAYTFLKEHGFDDFIVKDIVLIEHNMKTVNDFTIK